ncbi:MAG: hypothetical protein KC656_21455 [Myxococcales bacterium]|nr:hypothetical protein [Myxococcales bacterium]
MVTALHDTTGVDQPAARAELYEVTHVVAGDYDREVLGLYTETPGRPQYAVVDRSFRVVALGLSRSEAFDLILVELALL